MENGKRRENLRQVIARLNRELIEERRVSRNMFARLALCESLIKALIESQPQKSRVELAWEPHAQRISQYAYDNCALHPQGSERHQDHHAHLYEMSCWIRYFASHPDAQPL